MQKSARLQIEGLAIQMPDFKLEANLHVDEGERVALVGRSGSGKTTLLRWIAVLPTGGNLTSPGKAILNGVEISLLPAEARQIGYVFQDQALFPHLTVLENVEFGLRMRGVHSKERLAEVQPWLEKLGLSALIHSSIGGLSGGERQRVALVRALVWRPKLLLLDEPFSALDEKMRSLLRSQLITLHQLHPVPMIFVTHDSQDVEGLATRRLRFEETLLEDARSIRRFSD